MNSKFQQAVVVTAIGLGLSATTPAASAAPNIPDRLKLILPRPSKLNIEFLGGMDALLKSKYQLTNDTADPAKLVMAIATPEQTSLNEIEITGVLYDARASSFYIATADSDKHAVIRVTKEFKIDGFEKMEFRQGSIKDGVFITEPGEGRIFEIKHYGENSAPSVEREP